MIVVCTLLTVHYHKERKFKGTSVLKTAMDKDLKMILDYIITCIVCLKKKYK